MNEIRTLVVAVTVVAMLDETVVIMVEGELTRQEQALVMREGPHVATSLGAGGVESHFSLTAGLVVAVKYVVGHEVTVVTAV